MIYGARIRQARELRGLTQEQLAARVGKDQSLIAHAESGFKEVSDEVIQAIAEKTELPISFFSSPPQSSLPGGSLLFRAPAALTRREANEALRHAELVFDLGLQLSKIVDPPPVSLASRVERPEDAARHTRMELGIPPNLPISNLIRTIERAGVWVLPIPQLQGREAFSVWAEVSSYQIPVIAFSAGRPGDRLRMSIAHELGHLVMHKQLPMRTVKEIEKEAFAFAAELLMPADAMRTELTAPITLTSIARLKPKWGVAMQALIYRAKELDMISERQYRYLFQQMTAKGWRFSEPANLDVPIEKPRLMTKLAEVAYGIPIKHSKLAAAIHVNEAETRSIMEQFASHADLGDDGSGVMSNVLRFQARKR